MTILYRMVNLMKRCEECGRVSDFTDGERCPSCKAFVPDANDIRLACLAIRKTWSPGTRLTRTNEAYRPQQGR